MSEAQFLSEQEKQEKREFRNINAFTDLPQYSLPAAGKVSIFHRISGFGLALMLPFLVYLLDISLTSELSYDYFRGLTSHWFIKFILLGLIWAYLHHFCAGVRHLFMDLHLGLDKHAAQTTARAVFAVSLPLTAVLGLKLFGVF